MSDVSIPELAKAQSALPPARALRRPAESRKVFDCLQELSTALAAAVQLT